MASFAAIRPSGRTSGLYEGAYEGRSILLTTKEYEVLRSRVRDAALGSIRRATNRVNSAADRYEDQQKVDAEHWIVAPVVKLLGRVRDPWLAMTGYVVVARANLDSARIALDHGDLVTAARLTGDGERAAEQAALMVAAYVDQIIGTAEMTVTVLQGVKTASEIILFLCAVAATGGAAGAGATALGLQGVGATTTLLGVTASTATWATVVGTATAITEEVAGGIVRAADGDQVDWGEIAVHAAIQVIVAKFSPGFGRGLSSQLSRAAVANPVLSQWIARVGTARVVAVATNLLMHEGSQIFATTVEDAVQALRGRPITWGDFGRHLWDRLTDPKGLLMAAVAGALGGTHPEASREPAGPPAKAQPTKALPVKSKTDNNDWREVNREVGISKPRKKATVPAQPPSGIQQTTTESAFRATPAERAAAYASEGAGQGLPKTREGAPIRESTTASPRGQDFESASMRKPSAFPRSIRADIGEVRAYQEALLAGEIGLERPQGANIPGRADFITAVRDPGGEMWIIANDAKTRSSSTGWFAEPQPGLRRGWNAQVKAAVDRASVGNAGLETEIRAAYRAGRVWVRQVNVDLSSHGQGAVSGISTPLPTPWGALLGPLDLRKGERE